MLTSRPTHGGGAPSGIDLEAGIAKITVRRPTVPAATGPGAAGAARTDAAADSAPAGRDAAATTGAGPDDVDGPDVQPQR